MTRHAHARPRSGAVVAVVLLAMLLTAGAAALAGTDLLRWGASPAADGAGPSPDAGAPDPPSEPGDDPDAARTPPPEPEPEPEPVELTIVAAGDVLLHQPVISSARTADGYDFAPLMAPMNPWVQGADLALCHLEVPVAPAGSAPSGYPVFGAPAEIAQGLKDAGWDGCSTASNHSVDRGWDGLVATLDALDAAGVGHVGTARTEEESARAQVYELERGPDTIRVAHLAATYGTNGLPVPADAPWSVQVPVDTDLLVAQAEAARADGADLVLVSVHCCVEYVTEPTAEQRAIAEALAASGVVDLVIGHHAHVPQPIERLDGGPDGAGLWVAHGLGNYLSNQDANCCSPRTDSGLLLTATVVQEPGGPARVTGAEWTAVTVDRPGGHRVHPMPGDRLDEGAGSHDGAQLRARWERVREAVGDAAPERTRPPEPTGPPATVVPRLSDAAAASG